MKHSSIAMSAGAAATTLLSIATAQAANDAKGVWMDDTGRGAVEIKACGAMLCGYVVAVKNTNDAKGCGKQIIGDAQSSGSGVWDGGWIYSPEKRKNYDVELKPLSDGTLRVVGYAGTKLFSRTMIWTRAPGDLKRCDTVETAAAAPVTVAPPPAAVISKPDVKAEAKSAATPLVSAPPAAAQAPQGAVPSAAATSTKAAPAQVKAEPAKPIETKPERISKTEPLPPAADSRPPESPAVAQSDNDDGDTAGEKPGQRKSRGGLKIGDLDLDKVLTRTKSGKCKLDLPWVKVQFNCEND